MQFNISIEELISDTFSIEAESKEEALEKARALYREGDLVLEPGNLLDTKFTVEE